MHEGHPQPVLIVLAAAEAVVVRILEPDLFADHGRRA
jgi:hypothetical protein